MRLSLGLEDKTHQAASGRTDQSETLDVAENDGETAGDRWDDEEDWGSLEVELLEICERMILWMLLSF